MLGHGRRGIGRVIGGERADGSSIFAGTGIRAGASDILLRPRVESAFLDPFSRVTAVASLGVASEAPAAAE